MRYDYFISLKHYDYNNSYKRYNYNNSYKRSGLELTQSLLLPLFSFNLFPSNVPTPYTYTTLACPETTSRPYTENCNCKIPGALLTSQQCRHTAAQMTKKEVLVSVPTRPYLAKCK
jgi:hypothetical protein